MTPKQKWLAGLTEVERADYYRRGHLSSLYGLNMEQHADLLTYQKNRCGVCRSSDPRAKRGASFYIDHDHNTGVVRGLLCMPCNTILGLYEKYQIPVAKEFHAYLNDPPANHVLTPRLTLVTGGVQS